MPCSVSSGLIRNIERTFQIKTLSSNKVMNKDFDSWEELLVFVTTYKNLDAEKFPQQLVKAIDKCKYVRQVYEIKMELIV